MIDIFSWKKQLMDYQTRMRTLQTLIGSIIWMVWICCSSRFTSLPIEYIGVITTTIGIFHFVVAFPRQNDKSVKGELHQFYILWVQGVESSSWANHLIWALEGAKTGKGLMLCHPRQHQLGPRTASLNISNAGVVCLFESLFEAGVLKLY